MNVLYLVHRIPFPPDKGDKIRSFNWLEGLAPRHRVHLLAFCDDPADMAHRGRLEELCAEVRLFPLDPRKARLRSLRALALGGPLSLPYFSDAAFRAAVKDTLARASIDVALCFSAPMAEYVREEPLPRVLDMVDVDSAKFADYGRRRKGASRHVYALEGRRLARYEERLVEELDAVILCTPAERELLAGRCTGGRLRDLRNGVVLPPPEALPARRSAPVCLFVGAMDYLANVDAVQFGAREIMPRLRELVPDATFRIVGRGPTAEVRALDGRDGVEVHGAVPDLGTHLSEAALSLVPLRIAQGIQNKVLEALAWALPVVTDPRVARALGEVPGEAIRTAQSADDYASACRDLLSDEDAARAGGAKGRAFVAERFSWEPCHLRLEEILEEAVARHARTGS